MMQQANKLGSDRRSTGRVAGNLTPSGHGLITIAHFEATWTQLSLTINVNHDDSERWCARPSTLWKDPAWGPPISGYLSRRLGVGSPSIIDLSSFRQLSGTSSLRV